MSFSGSGGESQAVTDGDDMIFGAAFVKALVMLMVKMIMRILLIVIMVIKR